MIEGKKAKRNFSLFSVQGNIRGLNIPVKEKNAIKRIAGGENSLYLENMVKPLMSTPKTASSQMFVQMRNENDDFLLNDSPHQMSTFSVKSNYRGSSFVSMENVRSAKGLFSTAKYYQLFCSDFKSGFQWNAIEPTEVIHLEQENAKHNSENSCFASPEESILSLSFSQSTSTSPLSENIKTTSEIDVVDKVQFSLCDDRCLESKYQDKGRFDEFSERISNGKAIVNDLLRSKSKKIASGQYCARIVKRPTSKCRNKVIDDIVASVRSSTSPNRSKIYKIWQKRGNCQNFFEIFLNPSRIASLGESQINWMIKEKILFMFVTHQKGSRFLQKRLTSATSEQLWSTFTHLRPDFVKISNNMYGNYVAQKYLELGSVELRSDIMETLHPHILSLSRGIFGCRVVQKLLECVIYKHKQSVAQQFAGSIVKYIYDQNGNHVVQKILECLDVGEINFVVEEVSECTFGLAMHPYGSRVIQRILEKVDRRDARPLLNEIKHRAVVLSKNQYGNYIIQ